MLSGTAIVQAADKVIEQGKQIAAHVLEASAGDIEFEDGRFIIAGTDRAIGIMELAEQAALRHRAAGRHADIARRQHVTEAVPGTYPERRAMSPKSRSIRTPASLDVVKYSAVNDFGTVINPLMVEGQVHGGVVQGIGQALMEGAVYDTEGQLLTGSFMDYAMPRAHDAPIIAVANRAGADKDQSARRQRLRRSRLRPAACPPWSTR